MINAFSYGGGVQSTAALVLAANQEIDYQTFIFCNVGEDSENPATLAYVRDVAMPYAQSHGLTIHELQRRRRDGSIETILGRLARVGSRSVGIPIHMSNGAPGRRACTLDFKIHLVAKWLKQHGATAEDPATVGLGISLDEWQRMRSDSGTPHERLAYPLIDLRLDRAQCVQIIGRAGLPIPSKSSCWFCPYHSQRAWQDLRDTQPQLYRRAVALERMINRRRKLLGKDQVYLSSKCKPLPMATSDHVQLSLFGDDMCESGYCHL